jgi:Vam6/Vps39-like protein vacuolar protein sorting-associated protein 39
MTIPQEAPLPHSARTIAFLNSDVVCLAYEADHVLFSLDTMSTIEITSTSTTSKPVASIGSVGKGAFTGLGGYMTLGLGAKLRPCATNVGDAEVLIAKDSTCIAFTLRPHLITLQTRASSLV